MLQFTMQNIIKMLHEYANSTVTKDEFCALESEIESLKLCRKAEILCAMKFGQCNNWRYIGSGYWALEQKGAAAAKTEQDDFMYSLFVSSQGFGHSNYDEEIKLLKDKTKMREERSNDTAQLLRICEALKLPNRYLVGTLNVFVDAVLERIKPMTILDELSKFADNIAKASDKQLKDETLAFSNWRLDESSFVRQADGSYRDVHGQVCKDLDALYDYWKTNICSKR